ncbi:thermonuclease family protein [Ramlibacter sp. WS9]|nr:thermonuclease family protein [Ramlibacter sp. WS9]
MPAVSRCSAASARSTISPEPVLRRFLLFALLPAFALGAASAHARTLAGVVTHVTDGDTIWVRSPGAADGVQVRLQGIDAPEICQPFGAQSRAALAEHVLHRPVRVTVRATDVYGRTVGRVDLQGEDLGAWLVGRGHAWSAHYQRRAGPYAQEEAGARDARRGLWANGSPMEPRVFRKRHGSCH